MGFKLSLFQTQFQDFKFKLRILGLNLKWILVLGLSSPKSLNVKFWISNKSFEQQDNITTAGSGHQLEILS